MFVFADETRQWNGTQVKSGYSIIIDLRNSFIWHQVVTPSLRRMISLCFPLAYAFCMRGFRAGRLSMDTFRFDSSLSIFRHLCPILIVPACCLLDRVVRVVHFSLLMLTRPSSAHVLSLSTYGCCMLFHLPHHTRSSAYTTTLMHLGSSIGSVGPLTSMDHTPSLVLLVWTPWRPVECIC